MSAAPVVIQCATPPEFDALRAACGRPDLEKEGRRQFFRFDGAIVLRGSIGKVWAAASAEFAIGRWKPELIIDFGAAGGLVSSLSLGDIVLAEKVVEHDLEDVDGGLGWEPESLAQTLAELAAKAPDDAWIFKAASHPDFSPLKGGVRVTRGRVASGDRSIQSPAERAAIATSFGAIAATWESAAIGRVARFHGVPYLSVRVITDLGRQSEGGLAPKDEFLAEYRLGVAKALPPAAAALVQMVKDLSRR